MINFKLTVGRVTNVVSPEEDGRIQIKAEPEHSEVSDDLLPWAIPFFGSYVSDTNLTLNTYNVGDMMWILYEDRGLFDPCYFIPFFSLPQSFNYQAIVDRLDIIEDLEDYEYGKIQVQLFDNGDLTFRNNANQDSVYLKGINTYVYFRGTGEIEVNAPEKDIKVHNNLAALLLSENGDILVNNETVTLEALNDGNFTLTNENASASITDVGAITLEGPKGIVDVADEGTLTLDNGTATQKILPSGDIEFNGNSKTFVTHTELNTALQTFITTLNTQLNTVNIGATASISAGGLWLTPLALGGLTLEITSAGTLTLKTGG